MDSTPLHRFFPGLTDSQRAQFDALGDLYADWNAKINVISRKDIDNLYLHHVVHSLAIARFLGPLADGTAILDVGTGGGFPGIPLAIYYPQCRFHLVDRIGKKIRVATEIASAIGLENVTFRHGDIGECHDRFDYVVSRAVMPLNDLAALVRKNMAAAPRPGNPLLPGLICLKGGDLAPECKGIRRRVEIRPISPILPDPFFDDKSIVYVEF